MTRSAASRLEDSRAVNAYGGHIYRMFTQLMGTLTAAMVAALATDEGLLKRLYKWLEYQLMEWEDEYELHLVGAWKDIADCTVRARNPRHIARVEGYEEPFRGIELDHFSHYYHDVLPRWRSDLDEANNERVIPGSDWMTISYGIQIKAHPTSDSIIIVRRAKRRR